MDDQMAWERLYAKGKFLKLPPHPEINRQMKLFKTRQMKRILDLGCGSGRHTVVLAKAGFEVYGLDIAPTGLCATLGVLAENNLTAHISLSDIKELPYDDEFFDAVISIQVIHHNRLKAIQDTVSEIWRILRPKGLVWVTIPVPRKDSFRKGKEVEPGTYIHQEGLEKGLPHHYFTKEELPDLFHQFSIIDLHIDSLHHHSILAEKL